MSVIDDEFPRFNNDYFCNCDSIIEKKLSKNNIVTWHLIDARLLIIIVATIDYYYLFSHLVVSLYHCVEYSLVFRLYIYLYLCIYILLHTFSLSRWFYIFIETWRSSVWLRDFGRRRRCHRRRRRHRRRSRSRYFTGIMLLLSNKFRPKWRRRRRPRRSGGGRQRRKRFSENLLLLFSAKYVVCGR